MNPRLIVPIAAVLLGLFALACSTETTVVSPDQQATGISVSGSGSVFGEPDVAVVTLGVQAQADSVGEARTQAAERMDAMLQSLKDGGVDDKDVQTSRFTVQPQYDFVDGRQILRGFFVDNVATVKIRAIDDTGALIDGAIEAGGDQARVDSLTFTIDDPSSLAEQARTKAVEDARKRAETLAGAAGVELGKARSIVESRSPIVPVDFARDEASQAAGGALTPVELGQLEVQVDVQVVYGLD